MSRGRETLDTVNEATMLELVEKDLAKQDMPALLGQPTKSTESSTSPIVGQVTEKEEAQASDNNDSDSASSADAPAPRRRGRKAVKRVLFGLGVVAGAVIVANLDMSSKLPGVPERPAAGPASTTPTSSETAPTSVAGSAPTPEPVPEPARQSAGSSSPDTTSAPVTTVTEVSRGMANSLQRTAGGGAEGPNTVVGRQGR